jgi:hypothetical protein
MKEGVGETLLQGRVLCQEFGSPEKEDLIVVQYIVQNAIVFYLTC